MVDMARGPGSESGASCGMLGFCMCCTAVCVLGMGNLGTCTSAFGTLLRILRSVVGGSEVQLGRVVRVCAALSGVGMAED